MKSRVKPFLSENPMHSTLTLNGRQFQSLFSQKTTCFGRFLIIGVALLEEVLHPDRAGRELFANRRVLENSKLSTLAQR